MDLWWKVEIIWGKSLHLISSWPDIVGNSNGKGEIRRIDSNGFVVEGGDYMGKVFSSHLVMA
jgi:hypothetical protein